MVRSPPIPVLLGPASFRGAPGCQVAVCPVCLRATGLARTHLQRWPRPRLLSTLDCSVASPGRGGPLTALRFRSPLSRGLSPSSHTTINSDATPWSFAILIHYFCSPVSWPAGGQAPSCPSSPFPPVCPCNPPS